MKRTLVCCFWIVLLVVCLLIGLIHPIKSPIFDRAGWFLFGINAGLWIAFFITAWEESKRSRS
jgi:hypothetical protein